MPNGVLLYYITTQYNDRDKFSGGSNFFNCHFQKYLMFLYQTKSYIKIIDFLAEIKTRQ
jgi:hypothetical protein